MVYLRPSRWPLVSWEEYPSFSSKQLALGICRDCVGILAGTTWQSAYGVQPLTRSVMARRSRRFTENCREAFLGMDIVALEDYTAFEFPVFGTLFGMLLET